MFEALAEAIETLPDASGGHAVVELAGLQQALSARLTVAVAALDASGDWAVDGSVSMSAWVRTHLGLTNQQAHRLVKTGRRLRDLPVTQAAWLDGLLSAGQVEVIMANVTDRRARLFAQHEAEVVPTLQALDVTATTIALRRWAVMADAVLDGEEPPAEPAAELTLSETLDGRGYVRGGFDAEGTDLLATALRLAEVDDRTLTHAQRQGQALLDVARWFLDHQNIHLGGRHRPHVNIVVTEDALRAGGPGRTLAGAPLPGLVVRKLTCDAAIHRVITDGASSILDYGRATRTIPPAVYTSLVLRDWGCRFPGCDRPAHWTEAHHLTHWEDGGPTNLANLALFCSRHHHLIHTHGWHLKLTPDGTLEVTHPDGTVRTSDPPGTLY